jgi:hypothetical protein
MLDYLLVLSLNVVAVDGPTVNGIHSDCLPRVNRYTVLNCKLLRLRLRLLKVRSFMQIHWCA